MNYKLFIDDIRDPIDDTWVITRSSEETIQKMHQDGCPHLISFDHDLGGDDTAMRVVNWMIETDLDAASNFIPADFTFKVHSANPVGAANIQSKLQNYINVRN